MLSSLNAKIKTGYVLALILLLISYGLIFRASNQSLRQVKAVTHSYTILNRLEILKADIADAETGVRGYIITKDSRYLQPYYAGSKNVIIVYDELRSLTADNIIQQGKLDTLNRLLKQKLDYLSAGMVAFQKAGLEITPEMTVNREPSKNTMDSIRLVIKNMNNVEQGLMKEREARLSDFFSGTRTTIIISLLTALMAILYSMITYMNENRAKKVSDEKARQFSTELESNIAELKAANAELQELRSIEKFASTGRIARTIAHEVRNPLTNISLATEQLQDLAMQNADSSILLDMISRNAARINQLVADLLNATKFVQLDVRKTNINDILEQAISMANDRIELGHIKVERYFSRDIYVFVDGEKIKLAFLNIIVNAIEAMEKDKGILQIRTTKKVGKCIIEIRDNGAGMDDDTQQKLFEPYFTAKSNGNGLGLTNTQNIILNHKGNIKVFSKPGQGTVFFITLNLENELEEALK